MRVILDNIRSLHNVGSIFRTADAVDVEKMYLCGITPSPIDRLGKPEPKCIKVSLGAEKSVVWEKVAHTWRLVDQLKKEGFFVVAVEQSSKSEDIFKKNLSKSNFDRLVLVVGNEVGGVSKAVLDRADMMLEIPMMGEKESLNVAVAFGVAVYMLSFLRRQESNVA